MNEQASKRILVTGATSGIGKAISRTLARDGHKVIAVGRNISALSDLQAAHGITPLALDVTDREALADALEGEIIDVLVNNAGIIPPIKPFQQMEQSDIDATFEVNLSAAIAATGLLLPGMIERGTGHVFFTGSTAGHAPFPNMAVYGASKAAVSAFAASLRCDLAGTGVRVTEIAAGRVETDLYRGVLDSKARQELYDSCRSLQPDDVARALAAALDMPDHVDITRLDILPTDQTVGGGQMIKRKM